MGDRTLDELEAAYYRGEFGRVVYGVQQLLGDAANVAMRPTLLFWKGVACLQVGPAWYGEAMSCLREGIGLAKNNRPLKARLIAALGKIHADAGDPTSFEPLVHEYEQIARTQNPEVLRWGPYIWQNLGTALYNACQWAEAAQAFTTVATLAHQFGLVDLEGRALHDLSGAELFQGNLAAAAHAMSLAFPLLPDSVWGHKKASRQAEYLCACGKLTAALENAACAMAHPLADDLTRADIGLTMAKTLLALGRPHEAKEKALVALDYAVKAVYYPGIHKITLLLQQIGGQARKS